MQVMNNDTRTVVNFYKEGNAVRTVLLRKTMPNVAVGQIIAFDHPQMPKCISGKVYNIQHAIFLDPKEEPICYIDVEVQ